MLPKKETRDVTSFLTSYDCDFVFDTLIFLGRRREDFIFQDDSHKAQSVALHLPLGLLMILHGSSCNHRLQALWQSGGRNVRRAYGNIYVYIYIWRSVYLLCWALLDCLISPLASPTIHLGDWKHRTPAGCWFLSACGFLFCFLLVLLLFPIINFLPTSFCVFVFSLPPKSLFVSLVVCSQITAKRLSLLVSHKQRAAFCLNGSRGNTLPWRKGNLLWAGARVRSQRGTLSPLLVMNCFCV